MRALIVYGSKNGSTKKIAEEIAAVLRNEGLETRLADAEEEIGDVERFDAVVVGSALYLGSWLKAPARFVRQNQAALRARPVFLFTSGLRSDDPRSVNPKVVSELRGAIKPRDHRFLSGSLDPTKLGRLHRAVLRLPGIRTKFPLGDFRDWNEVRSWARGIARSIGSPSLGKVERTSNRPSVAGSTAHLDSSPPASS